MILLHKLWLPHIFWWLADCGLNPENHLRQSMQVSPEGNQFDLRLLLHQNRILDCMFIFRLAAWIGISTSLDNWQTADSIRKIFSVTEWRYKLKKKRIQWVTLPSNYADKLHNLWPCSLFFFQNEVVFPILMFLLADDGSHFSNGIPSAFNSWNWMWLLIFHVVLCIYRACRCICRRYLQYKS